MSAGLFFAIMLAMGAVAIAARNGPMLRTVAALMGCSAIGLLWRYAIVPDSEWPWLTYAVIDLVGATIVISHPACRWQGWIGLCFLIQVAMNVGYGAAYLALGYSYDAALLAWEMAGHFTVLKLFLLGAWGGLGIVDHLTRRAGFRYYAAPHHQRAKDAR